METVKTIWSTMVFFNIGIGDVIGAAMTVWIFIDLIRQKKWDKVKDEAEKKGMELINSTLTNKQRLQAVVDFLQSKFTFLAKVDDAVLINLVNEVYVNRVKPKADAEQLWSDPMKTSEGIMEIIRKGQEPK